MKTDIVVIGGGVTGTAIARELARYHLNIILLEKEDDVAMGASKANSGIIHAGYNVDQTTLKGQLNIEANPMFDQLCRKLNVPFQRIGSLVVGFDQADLKVLIQEEIKGQQAGIKNLKILAKEQLRAMEPNLNQQARFALYAPSAGIISSYEFTISLANSAVLNGVKVLLETEVNGLMIEAGKIRGVETNRGKIAATIVINAAGLYSDKIAQQAGDQIKITPRKGEYHLLDKNWGDLVNHVIFPIPTKHSKGILVTPTVHGNLLIGPNSSLSTARENLAVSSTGLKEVYDGAKKLFPGLSRKDVIASFSGLRATAEGDDFIIGPSANCAGLINVAGIQSPGLTSAPAIAKSVIELVKDTLYRINPGLTLTYRDDFIEELPKKLIFTEYLAQNGLEKWQEIIDVHPEYGEIICRCEKISKGEIISAIHDPVPARSIDAVKRRTRTGAGRCQGGFCEPRLLAIMSEELGLSPLAITKKGAGSAILKARTKDWLREQKNYTGGGEQQ